MRLAMRLVLRPFTSVACILFTLSSMPLSAHPSIWLSICPSIGLSIHLHQICSCHPSPIYLEQAQSYCPQKNKHCHIGKSMATPLQQNQSDQLSIFITAEALLHAADFYFGSATVRATPSEKTNATTLRKWMVPSMPHRQQPRERNKQG